MAPIKSTQSRTGGKLIRGGRSTDVTSDIDGVGTETKIMSEPFTVCSILWVLKDGSLSYILIVAWYSGSDEKPCSTADPTKPLPIIPIFTLIIPFYK